MGYPARKRGPRSICLQNKYINQNKILNVYSLTDLFCSSELFVNLFRKIFFKMNKMRFPVKKMVGSLTFFNKLCYFTNLAKLTKKKPFL